MQPNLSSYPFSLKFMTFLLFFVPALFSRFIEASALPSLSMDQTPHVQHAVLRDFLLILLSQVHQF